MSAGKGAFRRLAAELAAATTPARRDELLDEWVDYRDRATEYDADQWGFNTDLWCAKERAEMDRRAAKEQA
ncbi:hypothetical protein [Streptomyces sp. NPDC060194]|uniref:hypothetical protein n=1 Tax=Streptomyces sp. NPDC060194 TaxID=3347069 RepID=UPI00365C2F34